MRNKKIGTYIARLLITMLTILGLGQTMVHAVEGNETPEPPLTDIVITKVKTTDDLKDMSLEDLAGGLVFEEHFSTGSEVLPGVSFTYYKVSDAELAGLRAGTINTGELADDGISTIETDEDGKVTISDLPEGNYWVVENPKGTIVDSKAVPFWLILPFTNQTGNGYLSTVHVYPKNTLTDDEPEIEKTVDESNVAIGDLNTWTVSLDIPVGIEDYDKFSFYDDIDSRLDFEGLNSVIAAASGISLIKGTDYTVAYAAPRLDVVFTEAGRINLADATSDTVDITIETRVNDSAIMGQEIENSATLEFDNSHGTTDKKTPEDIPSVHTGGKAFVKKDQNKDKDDQDILLEGAEFKIQNAQGQFVNVGTNGEITFGGNGTTFTSDENGKFEVKGLPYGEYVLVEIKAPQGYALPTDPNTDFTVSATSYYEAPAQVELGTAPADVFQDVPNRRLVIPQTGGMGTVLFTVVGAVMMLFSALFYKRTKEA